MTSNSDGKTSGSGTLGIFAGLVGVLAFFYGVIDYSFISKTGTIMTQSIVVITIGAGLLGYRKSREASIITANNNTPDTGDDKDESPVADEKPKQEVPAPEEGNAKATM
jgi:hypothetical protein